MSEPKPPLIVTVLETFAAKAIVSSPVPPLIVVAAKVVVNFNISPALPPVTEIPDASSATETTFEKLPNLSTSAPAPPLILMPLAMALTLTTSLPVPPVIEEMPAVLKLTPNVMIFPPFAKVNDSIPVM